MHSLDSVDDKVSFIELVSGLVGTAALRGHLLRMTGLDEYVSYLPPIDTMTAAEFSGNLVEICIKRRILKNGRFAIVVLLIYVRDELQGHEDQCLFLDELIESYIGQDLPSQQNRKIKVLWISSNPLDTERLDLVSEEREIARQISRSRLADKIMYVSKSDVLNKELSLLISNHQPHILQFSGHANENSLIFEKESDRKSADVSKSFFVNLLKVQTRETICVLLLCNPSNELAKSIVANTRIPYAIGVSNSLGNESAVAFVGGFYGGVANGLAIPAAFEAGKTEIGIRGLDIENQNSLQFFIRR